MLFLANEARRRYARARASEDLGASAIEWVIITGILVAIAAAIGLVIYNLVKTEPTPSRSPTLLAGRDPVPSSRHDGGSGAA